MSEPWAPATPSRGAVRWLEDTGIVPLRAKSIGVATATGLLGRIVSLILPASGHSSVSGTLSMNAMTAAASAGGSSVAGELGWLYQLEGMSSGQASVEGSIIVGQNQGLEGASAGATTAGAVMSVKVKFRPTIAPANDYDTLVRSGRDDGTTRRVFTPISTGRANDKSVFVTGSGRPGSRRA